MYAKIIQKGTIRSYLNIFETGERPESGHLKDKRMKRNIKEVMNSLHLPLIQKIWNI